MSEDVVKIAQSVLDRLSGVASTVGEFLPSLPAAPTTIAQKEAPPPPKVETPPPTPKPVLDDVQKAVKKTPPMVARPPRKPTMRRERDVADARAKALQDTQIDPEGVHGVLQRSAGDPSQFTANLMKTPQWAAIKAQAGKVAPHAAARGVFDKHVGQMLQSANTPEEYGQLVGTLMSYQRANTFPEVSKNALIALQRQMTRKSGSREWTPEQYEKYKGAMEKQISKTIPGGSVAAAGLDIIGMGVAGQAAEGVGKASLQEAQALERGIHKFIEQDPEGTGFTDWITNNWQTLLIPAGAIAMLFGGNVGKVLGALAIVGGGYDLYRRYDNLVGEHENADMVKDAISAGLKYHNPTTGKHEPFGNIDAIASQYGDNAGMVKRGMLDFAILLRSGFKNTLIKQVYAGAEQFAEDLARGGRATVEEGAQPTLGDPSMMETGVAKLQNLYNGAVAMVQGEEEEKG